MVFTLSNPRDLANLPSSNHEKTKICSWRQLKEPENGNNDIPLSSSVNHLDTLKPHMDKTEKIGDEEFIFTKERYAPEGPWGWLIVFVSFCASFIVDGICLSYGVMTEDITSKRGNVTDENGNEFNPISITEFNAVGSALFAINLIMGPFAAIVAENIGFRWTSILGSVIATVGILLTWIINPDEPSLFGFVIGFAVLGGVGLGLLFTATRAIVGLYFKEHLEFAIGLSVAGTGAGTLVVAPVINRVLEIWGWQGAIFFQTGLCAFSILLGTVLREVPQREVKVRKSELKRVVHLPVREQLRELLSSPSFLIVCLAGFLTMMGYMAPIGFIADRAKKYIDKDAAVYLLSILGVTNALGRIFFGLLANKFRNSILISNVALTIGGIVTALHPYATTHVWMITSAIVFGMYAAVIGTLRPVIVMEIVGEGKFNVAFGFSCLFLGLGSLFSNSLGGYLRETTTNYDMSFYVAGAFLVASAVICYPLPWIKRWEKRRDQQQQIKIEPKSDISDESKKPNHHQHH